MIRYVAFVASVILLGNVSSFTTPSQVSFLSLRTDLGEPSASVGRIYMSDSASNTEEKSQPRPQEGRSANNRGDSPRPQGRSFSNRGDSPRPQGRSFSNRGTSPRPNGRSFNGRNPNRPQNRSFSSGGQRRPPSGGGGFKLENPLKLQRIAAPSPPPRQAGGRDGGERRPQRPQQGRPQQRARPGADSKSDSAPPSRGGGDSSSDSKNADRRVRRQPPKTPQKKTYDRNRGRTSLRIGGTGKKGRGAALSARRGSLKRRDRVQEKVIKAERALERKTVQLSDGPMSVSQIAEMIDEKPISVIKYLMTDLGVMASMTQNLDPATCIAVVEGFGRVVGGEEDEEDDDEEEDIDDDDSSALSSGFVFTEDEDVDLKPRPPVVTIMGHVDHGKTSLLDAIRDTRVTAGEAGGITQHIAAYQVEHQKQKITFIDTPGHAAFTDMRERGANITDIVILVVAADDGVKKQTADSIACARQSGVPVVVAINKCDLEAADPTKVMSELTAYDLLTEEFGGEILSSQISAKEGTNIDDLLDKVMLQAEMQNLKANPDREAEGIIVEAQLERGLGTVATTLIKKGTLRVGDIFVAGTTFGRVKALMSTEDGKTRLKEAPPGLPVRVVGFETVPNAGDVIVVVDDEQRARELAESRKRILRERSSSSYQDGLMSSVQLAFGSSKESREMCVVVKADVQGSAEALTRALRELKLENEEAVVTVKVLVSEAGEVSKSDIAIASVTANTNVIAFNIPASFDATEDARKGNVPIEYFSIVYDAIDSVESRMQEVLSPTPEGEYTGSALVQEVFNIGGTGNIAGSKCTDGTLRKGGNVRVMRGDKILIETNIRTLRNFKSESDTIEEGNDCGIGLIDYEDFQSGDVIECYVV